MIPRRGDRLYLAVVGVAAVAVALAEVARRVKVWD